MSAVRDLADRSHEAFLTTHPFVATMYGIPGYDDRVPDVSEEGAARRREELEATIAEATQLRSGDLSVADSVTLGCVVSLAEQEVAELDSAEIEHTVTAMPFSGPATLMALAARTIVTDEGSAGDFIERLRASGRWIDQISQRLLTGAAKGRLPVRPLVDQALAWAEPLLRADVPPPITVPGPPEGDAGGRYVEERDRVVSEVVKPALARWAAILEELAPRSRPSGQPGLVHLPGGEADYARSILARTTLPLTAEEIHATGRAEIERLEARELELGAEIGLVDLAEIHSALRDAAKALSPAEAMARAVEAVRRAEARAAEVFPAPLPPPCEVTPMPPVVAQSGMAPHYTPPRLDGSRPGTYWFNTELPTAGTGWDLEGVAFHEAVPGHHLQLSRLQLLDHLPEVQRQRSVPVFAEGWGLYSEQLAEEMGLYSGTEALLGAVTASLMRAARLVLDTGIHAFGWSREEAVEYFVAHVPMPPEFLANEVDRYTIMPGQALCYLTGKLEIMKLRERAERELKGGFDLPRFHGALLDSGSLPMPVLHESIGAWLSSGGEPAV